MTILQERRHVYKVGEVIDEGPLGLVWQVENSNKSLKLILSQHIIEPIGATEFKGTF